MKTRKSERLHIFILIAIVFYVLFFGLSSYIGIAKMGVAHFFLSVGLLLLTLLFLMLQMKGRAILCSVLVTGLFLAVALTGIKECMENLLQYGKWILAGMPQDAEPNFLFEALQIMWMLVIACVISYALEHIRYAKMILASILFISLITCMICKIEITHLAVVTVLAFILFVFIDTVQQRWKKTKVSTDAKRYVNYIFPFILLYAILMIFVPTPKDPYGWPIVTKIYQEVKEAWLALMDSFKEGGLEDFGISMSGFATDGEIKGDVADNNNVFMEIGGYYSLKTNIYLVGMYADTFNGREWSQTVKDSGQDQVLDMLETSYLIERLHPDDTASYLAATQIRIKYEHFRTRSYFVPEKTIKMKDGENTPIDITPSDMNPFMDNRLDYGTRYYVTYNQMNVDHELFYDVLNHIPEENKRAWRNVARVEKYDYLTVEDLYAHQDKMIAEYSRPVEVSDGVQEWINQATKNADNDLDRLRCIEQMLQNYTYTKTPGDLPSEIDSEKEFLDYFLLEKKEGYCTHFATAFVLLARCLGCPARMVQGFCVPIGEFNAPIQVTGNMAHAWPEVYFKDFGWMPFEPTAGYKEIRYTPWRMSKGYSVSGGNPSEDQFSMKEVEEIAEQYEDQKENSNADRITITTTMILQSVLLLILLLIIIISTDILVHMIQYKHMSIENRYRWHMDRILIILGKIGIHRKDYETLEELRNKIDIFYEEHNLKQSKPVSIADYEKVLYGGCVVTEEMLLIATTERKHLIPLQKRASRWKELYAGIGHDENPRKKHK